MGDRVLQVGDGRSALSRAESVMSLAERPSSCTSKESRQLRGRESDERKRPAIRLASSSRGVASQ